MKTRLSFLPEKSGIFLLILLLLLIPEMSAAQTDTKAVADAAILPWLGVWTAIDETDAPGSAAIEIRPGADGRGLEITTKDAEQPVSESIIPDGVSRPVVESKACTGTRKHQWEKQTGILLGELEVLCPGEAAVNIFTLKMLTAADRMADILAIKSPDQTRVAVRHFAFEKELPSNGEYLAGRESLVLRTALSAPWDLDKIISLSKTVETVVLEAALLEKNLQVNLDARSLRKMKSAGTSDSIIDLLVALSAPDKFNIVKNDMIAVEAASSNRPQNGGGYAYPYAAAPPYYGYYYPWGYYWNYYSPFWWGYPIYMYPNFPSGGGNTGGGTGGGRPSDYSEGRLSSGSGYVQVTPRDIGHQAVPRGSATSGGYAAPSGRGNPAGYSPATGSASSGGGYSAGGGSSSGVSSGSSGVSSGVSASPSGYSGGGSEGSAVPR
jgi:hypothetical protein